MNRAVFFDRDGTLIKEKKYVKNVGEVEICDGVAEALSILKKMGFLLIVVTNQSGVARGFMTCDEVANVNNEVNAQLRLKGIQIDDFFFCPHYEKGVIKKYSKDCDCRKPKIGLAIKAKKKYDLDLSLCYMLGDKKCDVEFGRNFCARKVFLINSEYGRGLINIGEDYKVDSIIEASGIILENEYGKGSGNQ